MIERIEHRGVLIEECTLPGERRKDDVVPAHPNGIQVSRDRWLLVYATRGFRFVDDDRSIIWQLREATPAGRLLKEGFLARAAHGWQPFGDSRSYFKQHGHPVVFGVPQGAIFGGTLAPHANVFVAKWRVLGIRPVHAQPMPKIIHDRESSLACPCEADLATQGVEWMQFRLHDREDDIEILQPAAPFPLRSLSDTTDHGSDCVRQPETQIEWMNQSLVPAVPFNDDRTEWAEVNHFDGGRIGALRYRFDPVSRRYRFAQLGPLVSNADGSLSEASLARVSDGWVIAARSRGAVQWIRTTDPFTRMPPPVAGDIVPKSPLTVYSCPDGVLRLFTGDSSASPQGNARDPLYCWDIDPDRGFASSNRRIVFDSVATGLPIRPESVPRVDFGKLLPHAGGRIQHFVHRVRTKSINVPANTKCVINEAEKRCCAIYHAVVRYAEEWPGQWRFA